MHAIRVPLIISVFALGAAGADAVEAVLTDDVSFSLEPKARATRWDAPILKLDEADTAYLRFDFASALPAHVTAAQIEKATLRVWVHDARAERPAACQVFRVTSEWQSGALLSLGHPAPLPEGEEMFASSLQRGCERFLVFDVTHVVQQWLAGTENLGLALRGIAAAEAPIPSRLPLRATLAGAENLGTGHLPTLQIVLGSAA